MRAACPRNPDCHAFTICLWPPWGVTRARRAAARQPNPELLEPVPPRGWRRVRLRCLYACHASGVRPGAGAALPGAGVHRRPQDVKPEQRAEGGRRRRGVHLGAPTAAPRRRPPRAHRLPGPPPPLPLRVGAAQGRRRTNTPPLSPLQLASSAPCDGARRRPSVVCTSPRQSSPRPSAGHPL